MTPRERRALFIFAHQDDEYAAAPWIVEELDSGSAIACVYLTNGGLRVAPAVRDAESRSVLQRLGVAGDAIAFLSGDSGRIEDQNLARRSLEALELTERWLERSAFVPTRLYAPSYEGGHADHDAAHIIATIIAQRRGFLTDAWHFALYNAYRCRKPFFSTLRQLPSTAPARGAALSAAMRRRLTMLCWQYHSQRRTWMGLFPGAFIERMVLRRERVIRFEIDRLFERPHAGELLYERLFATRYDDVAGQLSPLRDLLFR